MRVRDVKMVDVVETDLSPIEKPVLCADQAAEVMASLKDDAHETLMVAYLTVDLKGVWEVHSSGLPSSVIVDIRTLVRNGLLHDARYIVLSHNHPSGAVEPSTADRAVFEEIKEAVAGLPKLDILDFVITGHESHWSYFEEQGGELYEAGLTEYETKPRSNSSLE